MSGTTADEAIADSRTKGAAGEGAITEWDYSVKGINFSYSEPKKVKGGYQVTGTAISAELIVTTTVTMPSWSTDSKAEQKKWNEYTTDLRDHEKGHEEIAIEGAAALAKADAAVLSKPVTVVVSSMNEKVINNAITDKFNKALASSPGVKAAITAVETRSTNYDKVTKLGEIRRDTVKY